MHKDTKLSRTVRLFRVNPAARILLLVAMLFVATYGGIELLRVGLGTESPLMVVSSESMVPTLNVGDIILVRGIDPRDVVVGMIIIFHSPSNYEIPIVHRVVGIDNQGDSIFFETKGDHNLSKDGWKVPAQNLMGAYVGKIPYLGLLSLQLRGPVGVTIIVLLVALIAAIEYRESKSSKH